MMDLHGDLEALLTEVHRRAEQRALERESDARRRAREVRERAEAEADAEARARLEAARQEARELGRRHQATQELARQRARLTEREARIEAVWAEAEASLRALVKDEQGYRAALERLTARAVATLAPEARPDAGEAPGAVGATEPLAAGQGVAEPVVVASGARGREHLDPERLEALSRRLGVPLTLAEDALDTWGGLEARRGRWRADLTFPTRLAQAREALRERVWRLLASGRPAADPGTGGPE